MKLLLIFLLMASVTLGVGSCGAEGDGDDDGNGSSSSSSSSSSGGSSTTWTGKCTGAAGTVTELVAYYSMDYSAGCTTGTWSTDTSSDTCGTNKACLATGSISCVCFKGSGYQELTDAGCTGTIQDSCN